MSNKEKLAEDYWKKQYLDSQLLSQAEDTKRFVISDFISGYEAAEQEMIEFAEWCNEKCYSYSYMRMQWDNVEQTESFTTQQLLDKFREHH